jgi:hypothetical protein
MSPAFTSHHGQNIAENALCVGRGATIFVSSVIASSCASHKVALRGSIPLAVEVIFFLLSCKIILLISSCCFFFVFLFPSKYRKVQNYIVILSSMF